MDRNDSIIASRVPPELRFKVVMDIRNALDETAAVCRDNGLQKFNGYSFMVGNFINRNIMRDLSCEKVAVHPFKRYSWTGEIITDYENGVKYTIMRKGNLNRIRKHTKDRPHYTQTLVKVLNDEFEAPIKQLSFDGLGEYRFSNETILSDYDSICGGHATGDNGFIFVIIAFETYKNELTEASLLFLDKDLDTIEDVPMDIKPDFAALTQSLSAVEDTQPAESKSSSGLVGLKKKRAEADTAESPVAIRAEEQMA